jgi:WD40 repeat protein
VLVGGRTGLRVFDVATGRVVRTLSREAGIYQGLTFTPDGRAAVGVGPGGLTWEVATGRETRLEGDERWFPGGFVALPGSRHVAVVQTTPAEEREGTSQSVDWLSTWEVATGRRVARVKLAEAWPRPDARSQGCRATGVAGLPNGRRVAVGDTCGRVHVFDALSGERLRTFDSAPQGPDLQVGAIAASPDGRYLASSCGGTILIWDLMAAKP